MAGRWGWAEVGLPDGVGLAVGFGLPGGLGLPERSNSSWMVNIQYVEAGQNKKLCHTVIRPAEAIWVVGQ